MITKSFSKKSFLNLVVLATLRQNDNYAYELNSKIISGNNIIDDLNITTMYTTLQRLEQGNLICSYWGANKNSARRKYYKITPEGKERYQELKSEWRLVKKLIDSLLTMPVSIEKEIR